MTDNELGELDSSCEGVIGQRIHFLSLEALVPNIVVAHIKLSAKNPTEIMYGYPGVDFIQRQATSLEYAGLAEKLQRSAANRGQNVRDDNKITKGYTLAEPVAVFVPQACPPKTQLR